MKQTLLLIYLACFFFGCKPEERLPDQYYYHYLTADQLHRTPYFNNPAFDTLTFVNNLNDTLVFAKTKIDTSWYEFRDTDLNVEYTKYHYHQKIKINYQTLKGDGSFGVEHVLFDPSRSGSNLIYYYFNDFPFWCRPENIGDKQFPTYSESIEINGKLFKDILMLFSPRSDSLGHKGYINQTFGIFHFIAKENNPIYTLQTH